MDKTLNKTKIILKKGDITHEEVDVIVNAANSGLLGGGGVDGAIHRAGGGAVLEECQKIRETKGRCHPGHAVMTGAGKLHAKHVVHAVGPIWHGGKDEESKVLKNAYLNSMKLAKESGAKSIAFPSISTGAYGYPIDQAAEVALGAIREFVSKNTEIEEVRLIMFTEEDYRVYEETLRKLGG